MNQKGTNLGRGSTGQHRLWIFFLIFIYLFILFIYDCVGSSFLYEGFLQLRQAGATLHRGARASHHRGLSCCGAQAPVAQAQQLWLTGLVAPRHVGSSQTRVRTRVPCIGRQILNHCATREAPAFLLLKYLQRTITYSKYKHWKTLSKHFLSSIKIMEHLPLSEMQRYTESCVGIANLRTYFTSKI